MTTNSNVGGEFRNLKTNGSATLQELRQFLEQMRGKSPREMLGALAESGLVRATIQATIGCIALMALFTAGPYFLKGRNGAPQAAASTKTKSAETPSTAAPSDTNSEASTAATTTSSKSGAAPPLENPPPPVDIERAAKKQGVGDTKHADPKSNPLEKELDNLLDKAK